MNKEDSFMLITNLARVRMVSTVVGQIYTSGSGGVDEGERRQVAVILQKWEDRLSGKVEKAGY